MVLYCIALYTDKLCTTTYLSNLLGTTYCTLFSDGSGCGICTTMFLFVKVFGCPCMAIDVSVVVVVSHIQRIGCQPEKNYFTRWPIPLVVC